MAYFYFGHVGRLLRRAFALGRIGHTIEAVVLNHGEGVGSLFPGFWSILRRAVGLDG